MCVVLNAAEVCVKPLGEIAIVCEKKIGHIFAEFVVVHHCIEARNHVWHLNVSFAILLVFFDFLKIKNSPCTDRRARFKLPVVAVSIVVVGAVAANDSTKQTFPRISDERRMIRRIVVIPPKKPEMNAKTLLVKTVILEAVYKVKV